MFTGFGGKASWPDGVTPTFLIKSCRITAPAPNPTYGPAGLVLSLLLPLRPLRLCGDIFFVIFLCVLCVSAVNRFSLQLRQKKLRRGHGGEMHGGIVVARIEGLVRGRLLAERGQQVVLAGHGRRPPA